MNPDILDELQRIYGTLDRTWDPAQLGELSPADRAMYLGWPEEIRGLAEFLVHEDSFPHPEVPTLFGFWTMVEINSDEGTFGQLRHYDEGRTDQVVMIGDDTFVDVAGAFGPAGAVLSAVSYDVEGADVLAPSLLALLGQADAYPPR